MNGRASVYYCVINALQICGDDDIDERVNVAS